MEVYPDQEIMPGCKAVLNISAKRAADLQPGKQVRMKQIKDNAILVGFDAREGRVNPGKGHHADSDLCRKSGCGGGSKSATFSFEAPCVQAHGGYRSRSATCVAPLLAVCEDD